MAPPESTNPRVCRRCKMLLPAESFEHKYRASGSKNGRHKDCGDCRKASAEKLAQLPYDVDTETGCWIWRGCKRDGYGFARKDLRNVMAHRRIYELHVGPIPEGMQLDHLCRNRACVNPEHLEPVTQTVNVRRGASVKLSMEKAQEIRNRYASGGLTVFDLMADYGVAETTIRNVIKGVRWKHDGYSSDAGAG